MRAIPFPPDRTHMGEVVRFGVVGITATLVHFLLLLAVVELLGIRPAPANGMAFAVAVSVTYLGQSRWVFRAPPLQGGARRVSRFAVSVLAGFLGNVGIMALATNLLGLNYQVGFVLALILVPAATFVLNKIWVFGDGS